MGRNPTTRKPTGEPVPEDTEATGLRRPEDSVPLDWASVRAHLARPTECAWTTGRRRASSRAASPT